jgi:hypothetical protein
VTAAPSAGLLASGEEDRQPRRVRQQRAVQQRDVHALPLPRPLAVQQRGDDALAGHEGADRVEHGCAAQHRRTVRLAHHGHEPAHRLHQHVDAGLVPPRAIGPEHGERAIHQLRIDRGQPRPVQAQPLGDAAAIGFDHDVGPLSQAHERGPSLGARQVEGDAALVAVDGDEDRALAAEVGAVGGARGVADGGLLDLDDVGPHVGQIHSAGGAGDEVRELEDAIAGQRQPRHRALL